jgi:hypothetical protein
VVLVDGRRRRREDGWRRADSRTRRFQEVEELKSKIEEMNVFKKLKFEEVEN